MSYEFQDNNRDDEVLFLTCPECDHEQDEAECFLGRLGWLQHFRCRYCGWMWSRDTREAPRA
jgi:transposase-like protein